MHFIIILYTILTCRINIYYLDEKVLGSTLPQILSKGFASRWTRLKKRISWQTTWKRTEKKTRWRVIRRPKNKSRRQKRRERASTKQKKKRETKMPTN